MIPIRDENPTRSFPFFNTLFIIINVVIFFIQFFNYELNNFIINKYSMIPAFFFANPVKESYRLITYAFLHGGWFHLISNMLFLYIFGDNVEDVFGHFGYLIFYFLAAAIGVLVQSLFSHNSVIPIIGASGAVSGVILSYMLMFPLKKVVTLFFLGFFIVPVRIPAIFYIGVWVISQVLNSFFSILLPVQGGIAYLVHLGGIITGYVFTPFFIKSRRRVRRI
ncbi:MAG: rhomboid family intramembrane serine protease [Brevinematia bacterium]